MDYQMAKVAIKTDNPYVLNVLGAPFGDGPQDQDYQKEWFTDQTDFWLDRIGTRPVTYFHGFEEAEPSVIGIERRYWKASDGVHFEVELFKDNPLAIKVWEAAQAGVAFASTGAISHMVRPIERGGAIEIWPIGELALIDGRTHRPANIRARVEVARAKATFAAAGLELPKEVAEAPDRAQRIARLKARAKLTLY